MVLEFAALFELATACAPTIAPKTIAAIVQVESGRNPYAINVNNRADLKRQPVSGTEAITVAKALLADGVNIDVGLGQINSKNLDWLGLSVEDAFEPCANLTAAGKVLETGFRSSQAKGNDGQGALQKALSAYNTGNHERGFENGYVREVLDAGTLLVPAIEATEPLIPGKVAGKEKNSHQADEAPAPEPPALDVFRSSLAKRVNLFD